MYAQLYVHVNICKFDVSRCGYKGPFSSPHSPGLSLPSPISASAPCRPTDRPVDADVFFRCEPGELDCFSSGSSYQSLGAQRARGIYHCLTPGAGPWPGPGWAPVERLPHSGCTTPSAPYPPGSGADMCLCLPPFPPRPPRVSVIACLRSLTMGFYFCRRPRVDSFSSAH